MQGVKHDVTVVGAGAAGLVAAWSAAITGASVLLLERNQRLGAKILISGGGKCNITHGGSINEVLDGFPAPQARFLRPSLYRFPNSEVIRLIESNGLVTHVRDDGRVFPRDGNAKDVLGIFERLLAAAGVVVLRRAPVGDILTADGAVVGVRTESGDHYARTVVLTTGGVSYPRTGTTGDGHGWVARLGHTIVPLRPALAPIAVRPPAPVEWRGVALRGGALCLLSNGKERARWEGDLLFSHEGVTGPAALELSTAASEAMVAAGARLAYDFAPSVDLEGFDEDLQAEILRHRGKTLQSILDLRLPGRVVPAVLAAAGVDGSTKGYVLTRAQRRALGATLKRWDLGAVAGVDIARGEVTAGGVALSEVNPHTMRSLKVRGLYLAGEILDIAGRVGGYNLQAAFSTGFIAGESAAREAGENAGTPRAAVTDAGQMTRDKGSTFHA
jgi:predicted Rossmann fold flavoprotein